MTSLSEAAYSVSFDLFAGFSRWSDFELLTHFSIISGITNFFPSDLEVAYAELIVKRTTLIDIITNVHICVRCIISVFILYTVRIIS